jgi:hypothetical protein
MPAATNAVDGYATSTQIADLEAAAVDVAALQLLAPTADQKDAMDGANAPTAGNPFATMADVGGGGGATVVTVPSDGTYQTAAGGGTNNIPSGWTPANNKQYKASVTAWAFTGGGERLLITVVGLVVGNGGANVLGSAPTISATNYTVADLSGAACNFNLSGGAVRLGLTGVALFALTWGCVFTFEELPDA